MPTGVCRWENVPDRSTLRISVTPDDPEKDEFTALAEVEDDTGQETRYEGPEIRPGPCVQTLRTPRTYCGRVVVSFTGQLCTAKVEAKVLLPDGKPFGSPCVRSVYGMKGDTRMVRIWVPMA